MTVSDLDSVHHRAEIRDANIVVGAFEWRPRSSSSRKSWWSTTMLAKNGNFESWASWLANVESPPPVPLCWLRPSSDSSSARARLAFSVRSNIMKAATQIIAMMSAPSMIIIGVTARFMTASIHQAATATLLIG